MKNYKMIDTWEAKEPYITTKTELFRLAYELFCGKPIGKQLEHVKKEFGTDIKKVIDYV